MRFRGALPGAVCAILLLGPVALSFFSGGYFDEARDWAGIVACLLAAVACAWAPRPLPSTAGTRVALAGIAGLAAWTLLSILWAPVAGDAYHRGQIAVLYTAGLLAGTVLLRWRRAAIRAVDPAVAGGVLIVIGYGLAGRLLPGIVHLQRSVSAEGRLEQPLTYWNAMGELAAIGLVMALRVAGDSVRPRPLRLVATAAAAPLGLGLYASFSRGALFAAAAGVITLVVVGADRAAWRSGAVALAGAVVAAAAIAPLRGVTSLSGSLSTREHQGLVAVGLLAVVIAAAVLLQARMISRERPAPVSLPRIAALAAAGIICVGLAVAIVAGAKEGSGRPLSGGATRLTTLASNRYAYWGVALRAFRDEPVRGVGAGGWAVYWLRYRTVDEFASDAHSLPLQTLAELGLVGLALLAVFLGGIAAAARRAWRLAPALAAGPIAGAVTYLAHSPLDWDWEMPALTLFALVLVAALLALADDDRRAEVQHYTPRPAVTPTTPDAART